MKKELVLSEIERIQKDIAYYEANLETNFEFSGVAFISYNR